MDLIFPSGLIITLSEKAKEECELIKTVLDIEDVSEIPINLPFELTDTYLTIYELSYDELGEITKEELEKWLQLKDFLGYYESGDHYDNEMKELHYVINKYKKNGFWSERGDNSVCTHPIWSERDNNVCTHAVKNGYLKILQI